MPAKNIYHDTVVRALIADDWTITDDPLTLSFGERELYVDLGAERATIGAERDGRKIAVEIHSFLRPSPVDDLEAAIGKFAVYRGMLGRGEPDRTLYLAVPLRTWESILAERFGQMVIEEVRLRLVVFDTDTERIVRWTE